MGWDRALRGDPSPCPSSVRDDWLQEGRPPTWLLGNAGEGRWEATAGGKGSPGCTALRDGVRIKRGMSFAKRETEGDPLGPILECLLFVAAEPVTPPQAARALGIEEEAAAA